MKSVAELITCPKILENNILAVYEQCSDDELSRGLLWYREAHDYCLELSKKYNKSILVTTGILAALSPRKYWQENKKLANKYFRGSCSHTKIQLEKCHKIYHSNSFSLIMNILGGKKTQNFFANILMPEDDKYVTLDRHSLTVVLGQTCEDVTPHQYNILKNIYIQTANKLGILPVHLQCCTWLCQKRIKKNGENIYNKAEIVYF